MTHEERLDAAQTALLQGDSNQAESLYREILLDKPEDLQALDGMGILCCQIGDASQGIGFFQQAIALAPHAGPECDSGIEATLLFHLALALRALGNREAAVEALLRSRDRAPNEAEPLLNLGQLHFELGCLNEAAECFQTLTEFQPENASAWLTSGYISSLQGNHEEAVRSLSEALRLDVSSSEACFYLAESLRKAERYEESLPHYQRMLQVADEWPQAVHGLGKSLLALGSLEDGWDAMEFRLVSALGTWERHHLPTWNGVSADEKTVLAYSEEGIAAELMFASCLPDLVNAVDHCVVECEESLHSLFRRSFPRASIVPLARESVGDPQSGTALQGRDKNPWGLILDEQIAFGSLPRHFRRTHEAFPVRKAYLVPDRERVEHWSSRLAEIGNVAKIGILWHGGWTAETEKQLSLPMPELRNLMLKHQGDAAWVCLQHGSKQKEIDQYRRNVSLQLHLFKDIFSYDLDEMAAMLTALDLVVTPPGYVAHLAGALGVKTWLLLPAGSDWRWNLGRKETLWHPSMQAYRQQTGQDWSELFATLGRDLKEFLVTHRPPEEESPSILAFPQRNQASQSFRKTA